MDPMSDVEIAAYLVFADEESRTERIERMRVLLELFGCDGHMLFFGGVVPPHAFEEMRLCYLNGLYISCVVMAQLVIEHILTGLFEMGNRTDLEGVGFKKLTEEALTAGLISQEEFDGLDELRCLRNSYTHSQPIGHETCFIRRAAETGSHPRKLFEDDARKALGAVARLLSRQPFSFD